MSIKRNPLIAPVIDKHIPPPQHLMIPDIDPTKLEVGDSIGIDVQGADSNLRRYVKALLYKWRREHPHLALIGEFRVEEGRDIYRIWRIIATPTVPVIRRDIPHNYPYSDLAVVHRPRNPRGVLMALWKHPFFGVVEIGEYIELRTELMLTAKGDRIYCAEFLVALNNYWRSTGREFRIATAFNEEDPQAHIEIERIS